MRMKSFWIVCLLGVGVATGGAQSGADEKSAEKAFRDSLAKQMLIARGFSDEREVDYAWTAQGLAIPKAGLRTVGSIKVASVKVKDGRIEIKGARETLEFKKDNGDLEVSAGVPVLLVIDLGGADAASVLPRLKEALFYANLEDALEDVPAWHRRSFDSRAGHPDDQPANRSGDGAWARSVCPSDPSSLVRPRIVHSATPEFSKEARAAKVGGNVMLYFIVERTGEVADVWIVRPAGYGLDQMAAKAVLKYQFAPATCAGEPVAASLAIEINFAVSG